ncbi:hypothetical protein [Chroococcidiopsis sp.]|uniref:hypothetical protein n=1 Tax=Chroococcidiopsis sp. TaxID=3088168 RepID=UPI003F3CD5A5
MANFTPGTGTIQASTLEGAALVACQLLQDLEESEATNPNNIAVNYFTGDKVVQVQWVTPITTSLAADGKLLVSGNDYVTSIFSPGGDVKSTALVSATLELFQRLQALEKANVDPEDPEAKNKVQIQYDIDALTGTISAELPIAFAVTNGAVTISAVPYLADAGV